MGMAKHINTPRKHRHMILPFLARKSSKVQVAAVNLEIGPFDSRTG